MVETNDRKLPVGIQSFEEIRKGGYLYVDKTDIIWQLANRNKTYNYLSRPRRFGKSVLVDTLEAYFMGKKELFEGLKIMQMETEWVKRPVIRLDMSQAGAEPESLKGYLDYTFKEYESLYEIESRGNSLLATRLIEIIKTAYNKTGQQVAILIDEYDAPLLDVVHEENQLVALRQILRNFFSPLKDSDSMLHFVFLTGITKFSQLSIFSELNNITNISMLPEYAGICGITKEEMLTRLKEGIQELAEAKNWTMDETLSRLKDYYDGYHFASESPDIFNPFSLLSSLSLKRVEPFWFSTGTPTYLINMMKKFGVNFSDFAESMEAGVSDFDAPTETMTTLTPLLYQSGYITIKDYEEAYDSYTLGIPNREVRLGLTKALIPYYVTPNTQNANNTTRNMARAFDKEDLGLVLQYLQTFLGTVPYCANTDYEGHYQQMFYVIFSLLTAWMVDVEVHTPNGRVDIVVMTKSRLYLIELKLNQNAQVAMQQINLKNYRQRFALSGLPITKVGVNFDSATHNITDWVVE